MVVRCELCHCQDRGGLWHLCFVSMANATTVVVALFCWWHVNGRSFSLILLHFCLCGCSSESYLLLCVECIFLYNTCRAFYIFFVTINNNMAISVCITITLLELFLCTNILIQYLALQLYYYFSFESYFYSFFDYLIQYTRFFNFLWIAFTFTTAIVFNMEILMHKHVLKAQLFLLHDVYFKASGH